MPYSVAYVNCPSKCEDPTCEECGELSPSAVCGSGSVMQSKTLLQGRVCACKDAEGVTCGKCVVCVYEEADWTPSTDTVCEGVEFEQTNSKGKAPKCGECNAGPNQDLSYPCAEAIRFKLGTKICPCEPCPPSGWSLASPSSCPPGESLQEQYESCCNASIFACAPEGACCCPTETGTFCPDSCCCCPLYYAPVGIGCDCAYVG
jgi:hypothetical protein